VPDINGTTIPGSVSLPLWTLIAAILALFGLREWERKTWFQKIGEATQALDRSSDVVEKLSERVETLSARVSALETALAKMGGAP
jgi:uncharacterized protein YlxW (UPF0749 family)